MTDLMGILYILCGIGLGIAIVGAHAADHMRAQDKEHEARSEILNAEITRLRAQVAQWINKE